MNKNEHTAAIFPYLLDVVNICVIKRIGGNISSYLTWLFLDDEITGHFLNYLHTFCVLQVFFVIRIITFTIWKDCTSQQIEHSFWKYLCAKKSHKEGALSTEMPCSSSLPFCICLPVLPYYIPRYLIFSIILAWRDRLLQKIVSYLASTASTAQIRFVFILYWMQTDVEFSLRASFVFNPLLTYWIISDSGVYHLSWDITSLEFDVLVLLLKSYIKSYISLFTSLYSLADVDFCILAGIDTVLYSLTSK